MNKKLIKQLRINETGFKSIVIDIDDTFMNAILMIDSIFPPHTGGGDVSRYHFGDGYFGGDAESDIDFDDFAMVIEHKGGCADKRCAYQRGGRYH